MKVLAALLLATLLLVPVTFAQETEIAEPGDELIAGDGGITPDNWLYGLDVAFDNIALALTWDPEAKAKLGLAIAEERLLEAKTMAERGKPEAVQIAQEQYKIAMQNAEQTLQAIPEDADNTTARAARKEIIRIQNQLENLSIKVALVIDRVSTKILAKAPESAKPVLEAAFARIEAHIANMTEKIEAKKKAIELRIRALENKTKQEIENETRVIEQEEGLIANRTARAEIIKDRLEAKLENLSAKIESLNISEAAKQRIIERIEIVKERIENISIESVEIANMSHATSAFGQQISELAQQLRTGNVTAQQLVDIATSHSEAVLAQINRTR
jgi:hypothetical protein